VIAVIAVDAVDAIALRGIPDHGAIWNS